ncbi:MAG: DUF3343 domain-containing protein [Tissierellia bacterium]|nr:DUF3343 domain-containing protein [Tissierellia bacterium]
MEVLLLTFESVHHTMKTESDLKTKGYDFKTIPTPREITTSCGLAIMLSMDQLESMKALKEKLPIAHLWKYNKDENHAVEVLSEENL